MCKWAICSCKNRPCFPLVSTWAMVGLQFLLLADGFRLLGFYEWNSKGFGRMRMTFKYFYKIFVPRSEGPPLRLSFILHRLRNKFVQLSMGQWKSQSCTKPAPWNRTQYLVIARPMLYLKTTDISLLLRLGLSAYLHYVSYHRHFPHNCKCMMVSVFSSSALSYRWHFPPISIAF